MALKEPFIIALEPPIGSQIPEVMVEIRSWLDRRRIQTSFFELVSREGVVGFQIGFRTEDEAELFRQKFGGVPLLSR